jgi:hypothetical protein
LGDAALTIMPPIGQDSASVRFVGSVQRCFVLVTWICSLNLAKLGEKKPRVSSTRKALDPTTE